LPDLPDQRDWKYVPTPRQIKDLPSKMDLRQQCSAIEDQGKLGSCTANALAGALEYLQVRATGQCMDASRLFIYYNERILRHSVDSDSGAMLRDGIKTLAFLGVCNEKLWPYKIERFAQCPPKTCYAQAKQHCIAEYRRLEDLDGMRACLAQGLPFVFGFVVYESFKKPEVAKSGKAMLPKLGEKPLGGHAVMAVGYDDKSKRLLVRNSWGLRWGMGGYFTLPYGYMEDPRLSADYWMIAK
jgi:C1A family cysteine protease